MFGNVMAIRELKTASEVIDALGGTAATARLTDRTDQSVSNWRAANRMPPGLYRVMIADLEAREFTASSLLWGIREPKQREAVA